MTKTARALVVAAAASGAGKTTATLGLLGAFARAGRAVAAAKSGPDYIDPRFHDAALRAAGARGAASATLDAWSMDAATLRERAAVQSAEADLLIVEGAMGVFDGAPGPGAVGRGSAADLAEALGAPVLLVLDAARQGATAAAVVAGVRALRPRLAVAGVLLNRVGSARHERILRAAFSEIGVSVFGALPRDRALETPSRHLGLTPAAEVPGLDAYLTAAARVVAQAVDLDALAASAASLRIVDGGRGETVPPPPLGQRIAVADDVAFAFAYPHLLDGWRAAGAEILPFSPLADAPPDAAADAVFLPGGYPELHAPRLAVADRFRAGLRAAADRGAWVYGECGGYMALGRGLVDADGRRWPMAGLLPLETRFDVRRLALGYRRLTPQRGGPFDVPLRGHEHHHATVAEEGDAPPLFRAADAEGADLGAIGLRVGRVCGSFAHIVAVAGGAAAATRGS